MCEPLELLLDTDEHLASLQFEYPSLTKGAAGALIGGTVRVEQGPLQLQYQFVCFGYDLDDFSTQLTRLHATLSGEARFGNQEGNVAIVLSVVDRGRGRLGVKITLEQHTAAFSTFYWVNLSGFTIEQSFVSCMTRDIERFLADTGVDRAHPMLRD